MGNCCCNRTEHYVVKPNTPVYDWPYEYSSSSNSNQKNCNCNSEALMVTIGNLQSTLASLQNAITEASAGNVNPQQIENIVNQYLQDSENLNSIIDQRIASAIGASDNQDISTLWQDLQNLKNTISNLDPTVIEQLSNINLEELASYGTQLQNLQDDLTNHINDNSKHFKSGDIHVTQEMVNRWNNNTDSGSSVSFEYDAQNKALQITA